jgi:hypothetical protein
MIDTGLRRLRLGGMLTYFGCLFVVLWSVEYLFDFLKDPEWGIRPALEIGVVGIGGLYRLGFVQI